MDNPVVYLPAVGFRQWRAAGMRPEQFLFITTYINYLHTAYETGQVDDAFLRAEGFADVFSGELGRRWWTVAGPHWRLVTDPTTRRFVRIADETYETAVSAGPPHNWSGFTSEPHRRLSPERRPRFAIVATAAIASAAGWLAGRRRRDCR